MTYLVIILALALGYVIGLMQKGINIHHHGEETPKEYNNSVGIDQYTEFYDKVIGVSQHNDTTR